MIGMISISAPSALFRLAKKRFFYPSYRCIIPIVEFFMRGFFVTCRGLLILPFLALFLYGSVRTDTLISLFPEDQVQYNVDPTLDTQVVIWDSFTTTPGFVGFSLVDQWTIEGCLNRSVFIRDSFFGNDEMREYLATHSVRDGSYDIIQKPFFNVQYWIDDDLNDSVKQILRISHNTYEGNISILIDELTRPGTIAIDMGAHLGTHTIFMSRKAGPFGAVIAFEPCKKLYMELLANLELNQCDNAIAICKGLGATFEKANLQGIQIVPDQGESIEIIPLDSMHLTNVSLIKMDVENYEYFVFQGAKKTLQRNRPAILFECWIDYEYDKRDGALQKKNFDRVMSLLEEYGYEVYVLYNCDFIAFPKERLIHYGKYTKRYQKLDPHTYRGEGA